ncbi:hypothetical protein BDN70DRAFT_295921 [Pholiota conissans]|uniref:Uncharacterized protein n=1 Tax=Pholiota conissans TaxID=109636 RepID=A0A9P5YU70_9AGAR|nr:hypothetical protein BDN70DRAFT_295921 [Pholiota conissans]
MLDTSTMETRHPCNDSSIPTTTHAALALFHPSTARPSFLHYLDATVVLYCGIDAHTPCANGTFSFLSPSSITSRATQRTSYITPIRSGNDADSISLNKSRRYLEDILGYSLWRRRYCSHLLNVSQPASTIPSTALPPAPALRPGVNIIAGVSADVNIPYHRPRHPCGIFTNVLLFPPPVCAIFLRILCIHVSVSRTRRIAQSPFRAPVIVHIRSEEYEDRTPAGPPSESRFRLFLLNTIR